MKTAMQELIEYIELYYTPKSKSSDLICEKAKLLLEKEKQQIIDAYHINPEKSIYLNTGIKYYEETFKN